MSDVARLMQYDAHKKSAAVAYLLWFFLGTFGAHRFYLSRPGTGAVLLIITLFSLLLMLVWVGVLTIWISIIWVFVDLFLIPGITREHNVALATQFGLGATVELGAIDRVSPPGNTPTTGA